MSDSPILLSICVPTYNRQFMLERNVTFHLEHFRRLGIPFELVLVDDCSTDGTADYIATLADEPEVNAYRRIRNSGFVSNYAFAMRRARGRYAVFLGDDDLLIPDKVAEYLAIMEGDRGIGMIQAPWLLFDGRPGGGDLSPFYTLPEPVRHPRGDFHGLLKFILKHHVFPEFLIVRRDILAQAISSSTPFIFWAFLYTARALDKADILFLQEPFARVTVASEDPRVQQGNTECMFQWDTYRGGLEYLLSQTLRTASPSAEERQALAKDIAHFMGVRQTVALRLLMQGSNWVEAYILYHRMNPHFDVPLEGITVPIIGSLAGTTMAMTEASEYSRKPVIVDPSIQDELLALLPPRLSDRFTRDLPDREETEPRAWLRIDPCFGEPMQRKDAVFDLPSYLNQFI